MASRRPKPTVGKVDPNAVLTTVEEVEMAINQARSFPVRLKVFANFRIKELVAAIERARARKGEDATASHKLAKRKRNEPWCELDVTVALPPPPPPPPSSPVFGRPIRHPSTSPGR